MNVMDHDPLDFKAQESARAEADAKERREDETEGADIKWLMGSRRGRRMVWRLLEQAGVFRSSFNPTAMQMAFNEGNRNYGNRTLALVHQHCPELYPQMLKEHSHGKSDGRAHQ
jgi:hypothetical protein